MANNKRTPDTTTENGAASFSTTGAKRVDLFFKTVRGVNENDLKNMLQLSWSEDALDTLRLIFQARDCRGGKGEKKLTKQSFDWLIENHPENFKKNIQHIPTYGTWKDMFYLLGTKFENEAIELIANQLKEDLKKVTESKNNDNSKNKAPVEISLCAKWAPTEGHKDDTATKVAKKLAKQLCKKSKSPLKDYRTIYLSPLRKHLKVVETFMCAQQWKMIPYSRVPSRCMKLQKKAFTKHDAERFAKFLEDVKSGKTTIKASQLFPHELVSHYMEGKQYDEVVELQWKALLEAVKQNGTLTNSLVVSDVSGSMSGTPMQVSIALGILLSLLTAEPFHKLVITFSEDPEFHQLQGETLEQQVKNLKSAHWGNSTNFQKVFDMILEKAVSHKLPETAMPKRIFVISDMQFNSADQGGKYKTNHQVLKKKYKDAGYEMPQIVYWNVRATKQEFPVDANAPGVALISGFSPSVLKLLMDSGDINPFIIMKKAVDAERYKAITL